MSKEELLKQIDQKINTIEREIKRLNAKGYGEKTRIPFLEGKIQGLENAYRLVQELRQDAIK